jgi:hypothetical protein
MNPSNDKQFFFIAVIEEFFFIECLARVGCAGLFGHDEARDEHGI